MQNDQSPTHFSGHADTRSRATWAGAGWAALLSSAALLTLFATISAIILTVYSETGIVTFQGQVVKWKILLFTLQLEAAIVVVVDDLIALGVDYFLVYQGLTLGQLGHALSHMISFQKVSGRAYKTFFVVIATCGYILGPILLSVVLASQDSNSRNFKAVPDTEISTNTIGGRVGVNYGATGQSFLFNASEEKYSVSEEPWHYVVYMMAGSTRQVFVPKTPQIGPYSDDCNSDLDADIVSARVIDVEGLLYDCKPTVREDSRGIEDFEERYTPGTSRDTMRLIKDEHSKDPPNGDGTKAKFLVEIAVKKNEASSTSVLTIPCGVTAAKVILDVRMDQNGIMTLQPATQSFDTLNFTLPRRVIGDDPNDLNLALENSIGRKGIGKVSTYVSAGGRLDDWEGLIRAIVGAYGIRSALHTTFADSEDRRLAVDVRIQNAEGEDQLLRKWVLWIPVALAVFTRIVSWIFPSIFSGGLRQVLCWLGVRNGGAGGELYEERWIDEDVDTKSFLKLEVSEHGRSRLWLGEERDMKLGLGTYRMIRRLTGRGLLSGWGGKGSYELGGATTV